MRFDRVRGQPHQIAAIVERHHFDVRRQDAVVQLFGFCFDALEHVLRLLAGEHQDDAFDGVIRLVEAEFAEARRAADGDVADIAHTHRHAVLRADNYVADVGFVAKQADSANVIKLAALRIEAAAGVRVIDRKLLGSPAYSGM